MTPTLADYHDSALCAWKEARGEGVNGMTAVVCVLRNRVKLRGTSYHDEVYRPWQFTSMTDPNDPEYRLLPEVYDTAWIQAQHIAKQIIDGITPDVTGGAVLYWNPQGIKSNRNFKLTTGAEVPFPDTWNPAVVRETCVIGHHVFLREI